MTNVIMYTLVPVLTLTLFILCYFYRQRKLSNFNEVSHSAYNFNIHIAHYNEKLS